MTRPLRYDDSFTNIINEKIHDKFLHVFNVKVQSTAFRQKLNLQRSLLIVSLWDITFGTILLFAFFNSVGEMKDNIIFLIENFFLIIGICFGFVGVDSATNLRKVNTKVYKNWRVFITFAFPILEMINNFSFFCYYWNQCSKLENFIIISIIFIFNIYWTKIAWSFYIRLARGHELLIIHGKYLDKMINDESYKLNDVKKYVPPEQLMGNKLLSATNTNTGSDSELSIFGNKQNTTKA
jgi:hypothetical protein